MFEDKLKSEQRFVNTLKENSRVFIRSNKSKAPLVVILRESITIRFQVRFYLVLLKAEEIIRDR